MGDTSKGFVGLLSVVIPLTIAGLAVNDGAFELPEWS
jgi:hypothetical protein